MSFSAIEIRDFAHMSGDKRQREVNRTRRAVVDLLNERGRTEFPDVPVLFNNKNVPAHVLDAAHTAARQARRAAGSPAEFDWLGALSAALPAALEANYARIARREPITHLSSDGARKNAEAARKGIPKELVAPLILEMPVMEF